MNTKRIMGVDVGMKRFGVALYDPISPQNRIKTSYETKSLSGFYGQITKDILKFNPDLIVTCRPTRFGNIIAQHNQLIGILCLVSETLDYQLVIDTDTECRRILFGKMPRKGAKDYAHKLLGNEFDGDKDAADAWIMARAYDKKLS